MSSFITTESSCENFDAVNHNRLPMTQVLMLKKRHLLKMFNVFFCCCFFFHLSDPSIKPKPTPEVDPTVFEKRFLKKVRDLGEVNCSCCIYDVFVLLC